VTACVLASSYAALTRVVGGLGEEDAWAPTGCTGWAVRDLVLHLHADAVRALVAVHTPSDRPADCDSTSYWAAWGSDPDADEQTRRWTRVESGAHSWTALRDRYVEAAAAAVRAVGAADPTSVVATQGHAITVADLASTLGVEATLHHLDLVTSLSAPGPAAEGLAEVRRVVEALLGPAADVRAWTDERVAMVGTGRARASDEERADLGGAEVPVFT
jgi:uncharacterized protein (TIGR03083 family)